MMRIEGRTINLSVGRSVGYWNGWTGLAGPPVRWFVGQSVDLSESRPVGDLVSGLAGKSITELLGTMDWQCSIIGF